MARHRPLSAMGSLQMNAIPRGSALEHQMNELMEDPIKHMPLSACSVGTAVACCCWLDEFEPRIRIHDEGVVDGGPDAYKGQGTSLPFHPLSLDRQHAVKWPQHYAHGVGFREAADQPYNIRLDRLPDGNQDVYFGETDAELEARLWGSWDDPQGLHEYLPETGWRDTLPDDDITGMPRPWTHKHNNAAPRIAAAVQCSSSKAVAQQSSSSKAAAAKQQQQQQSRSSKAIAAKQQQHKAAAAAAAAAVAAKQQQQSSSSSKAVAAKQQQQSSSKAVAAKQQQQSSSKAVAAKQQQQSSSKAAAAKQQQQSSSNSSSKTAAAMHQQQQAEFPPHHRDPSPGPPEIPLEVELAAAGMWRGYVLEPGWTRHAEAIAECNKAQQWRREEAEAPPQPHSRKMKPAATAKKQEKQRNAELLRRTQDIIKAHWADIRKHPVYVRAVIEGATHAAAAAAAALATPRTAAEMAMGKDITEGLEMQETLDLAIQGEVNPPNAEGKTLAVNLALYSLSPYSCRLPLEQQQQQLLLLLLLLLLEVCCCSLVSIGCYLSPRASVAEHEELYHYLMAENHREGRYTDFHLEIAATQDIEYRLRHRRQSFPRLMALYRPLWAKRKYGEEFGEPLEEEEEEAHDEAFINPAVSLYWTSRGSTSSSSSPLLPPLPLPSATLEKDAKMNGRPRQTRSV
ncbi:hypothetical protein Emag_004553 [Eimeria magna]